MGSKDLHPSFRDDRRTFKYGTNRMVELTLRHELDDVAKKSLDEIVAKKELEKNRPLDNEEFTSRRLRPAFIPRRNRKRMTMQPIFHDDLLAMKPKAPEFQLIPNIPPYNPLDKFGQPKNLAENKMSKFPYTRENTITTEELKKARVTSMGVLPNRAWIEADALIYGTPEANREDPDETAPTGAVSSGADVPGLKVVMEGKPVTQVRDPELEEMEEANMARPVTPGTPDELDVPLESISARQGYPRGREKPGEAQKKPAIIGSEGTSVKVSFATRPGKQAPQSTLKRRYGRSAHSLPSSLHSREIILPGEEDYRKYDEAIADIDADADMENVQTAVGSQKDLQIPTGQQDEGRDSGALSSAAKSVKDMLDEAKRISSPGAEPVYKMRKRSPRKKESKKDVKKGKEKGKGKKDEDHKEGGPRTERTVDEIIASLRSQSRTGQIVADTLIYGTPQANRVDPDETAPTGAVSSGSTLFANMSNHVTMRVSEADRKIQEIMNRVMARSSDDEGLLGPTDDSPGKEVRAASSSPAVSGPSSSGPSPSPGLESGATTPGKKEGDKQEAIQEEEEDEETDRDEHDRKEAERYLEERLETGNKGKKVTQDEAPLAPPSTAQAPPAVEALVGLVETESEEEEEEDKMDIQKAWEELQMPDTSYEELVGVTGKPATLEGRHPPLSGFKTTEAPVYSNSVSFLSAWKPVAEKRKSEDEGPTEEEKKAKSVHHFCTMTTEYQLPEQFWNTGRKYHTPSRFQFAMPDQKYRFGSRGPSAMEESLPASRAQSGVSGATPRDEESRRISAAARRVLQQVKEEEEAEGSSKTEAGTASKDDSLEAWKGRAEEVFEQPKITGDGKAMPIKFDESRLYWAPAPPKLDVAPGKVKDILFPEYQRPTAGALSRELQEMMEESSSSEEEEEETEFTDEDREQLAHLERVLLRRHNSVEDLTEYVVANRQREQDIKEGKIFPFEPRIKMEPAEPQRPQTTPAQAPQSVVDDLEGSLQRPEESEPLPIFALLRRASSAPDLNDDEEDDTLMVTQDYNSAMEEIARQKHNVRQMKLRARLETQQQQQQQEEDGEEMVPEEETIEGLQRVDPQEYQPDVLKVHQTTPSDEPTPAEKALAAGRAYVILPKKKKKKKKDIQISIARLDDIENFLRKKPRKLARTESMIRIPKPIERELRVPSKVREGRKNSLPESMSFEEYGKKRGLKEDDDTREWVRDIWNGWFDEVFPPTPEESDYDSEEILTEEQQAEKEEEEKKKRRKSSLSSTVPEGLEYIDPIDETEESLEVHQIIAEEIEKLTGEMNKVDKPKAFDYSRRGALYRKIGYLKAAEEDLSRGIEMEPLLLDAYWHRHLLFVLQDRKKEALEDLTFILKHTKSHAGAYRSMAEIYKKQGDITMSIVNYTQAIKLNPRDHEAYYARAGCYEARGDILLALEDYSTCTKIAPTRVDAILKHGMHYFENKSWNNAINDFTDLLRVDPLNAHARVLRGRAFAAMGQWNLAVEDLSAAIHLDPNHWEAFYHRACILRKAHPKRALHDYSVSLLINDSEENISSYLHRGILYNAMGKPEDAMPDFESVLKLNKDNACAHVNLGLIMMTHYDNYHRAIKRFTSAIKVDPTYVRAYVCRGEAYHKIHELKLALRDFTRAIHLKPDVHHYYMYRGQLLLELGHLDLAAFCVRHASEISSGSSVGQRPTQQAVVHSFLKNYDKAIDALQLAARSKPGTSMHMLLGKTQMKAKKFSDAIVSFESALQLFKPWKPRDPWPIEAADAHYLIGQCNMELRNYLESLEAFTNAIKLNPNMAEALYQRGMARMKLKMSKGIQDFNRALAINPTIFQAYLSRACYYGTKGNYTKAILNCNEAIRLQPNSVRAYLYRGALKFHIKAYELAIRDLSKAASVDSCCALAYFNRAVCYQENKDWQKALTDYGIVLLLGEQLKLKVLINRGLLYFERKDYINALYDFKLAAGMNPTDHKILHTLGLCYHKLGRLDEAVKTFTTCMASQPFFLDGIIARGNVYMDFPNGTGLKSAMHDYQRVLRLDPMCLPARVNLAYTLQVSGRFMQAWRQFATAIDLKPSYKPALEGRSIINLQMSDTFAAYQDINAAIQVNPTAELLTNRGVIHQFMDDRVNAMRDYQEALKLDPTYSLAYFNAGNVYFHTRQFSQALDYFTKTVENNPKDESAFLNRAITRVMLKDAPGALQDFKAAIKLSPYSAHMYLNRANLYASTQQYEKADKDYTKALDLQPDDPLVLRRRADVRGKMGRKDEAVADYRQAIELQARIRHLESLK